MNAPEIVTSPGVEARDLTSGRRESQDLPRFASVAAMVAAMKPSMPVHCLHPDALRRVARTFLTGFPGHVLYAVKVNANPHVLRHLYEAGVRRFDVASLAEIRLVHEMFPDARLAYMHPVKSRESIRAAYFAYGVRDFAIDTFEELHKILEETGAAVDLGIHVRLTMPKGSATHDLSTKFGVPAEAAAQLLRDVDKVAHRVGVCFHVGSQCMDPDSYAQAIARAGAIVKDSGVVLDVFDVGGGFPVAYPGMTPPPLSAYFDAIRCAVTALDLPKSCEIWGEPGRALATPAETLVVRVELRKGQSLYINDGGYGSLLDGMLLRQRWPVQLVRTGRPSSKTMAAYDFYGPTCDTLDHIQGPFMLPDDVCEGDWIAISQQGAYCAVMQTGFNGFRSDVMVEIDSTMSSKKAVAQSGLEVVAQ